MPALIERWKQRARQLKIEVYAIYLAYQDPRVPLHARIFAACVVGYAFSEGVGSREQERSPAALGAGNQTIQFTHRIDAINASTAAWSQLPTGPAIHNRVGPPRPWKIPLSIR